MISMPSYLLQAPVQKRGTLSSVRCGTSYVGRTIGALYRPATALSNLQTRADTVVAQQKKGAHMSAKERTGEP